MDPLSLLSRLAASVPYPRFHTVRYSGVLASASKLQPKIAPQQELLTVESPEGCVQHTSYVEKDLAKRGPYRPWAELLERTLHFDVLTCPKCQAECVRLRTRHEGAAAHFLCLPAPAPCSPELERRAV
jgi:hypothetical protein